ncbi:MAG: FlgO family outer membrane protein [Candidatus Krumholzibacteriota bacterium]
MIGKTLAHYEILAKIGQGGMGEVYRALDKKLDREVALKIVPTDMARDPDRLKRFEREAKTVAALKHPNIVTIYSVEEAEGLRFLTMELVEGRTLTNTLLKEGLPLDRLFDIAIPLVDAVSSAHTKGITHRDLKPDNIMIDGEGRLRVLDFGLAKLQDTQERGDGIRTTTVSAGTEEGKILGTVAYMSPEQAEGKAVDARSDIFSLGTILYEMATGTRPFLGDTSISTIGSILKDEPVSVTELNYSMPRHAGRIIGRCLAKDPGRRYQTAVDLRNDLDGLKDEIESGGNLLESAAGFDPAADPGPPHRSRAKLWLPVIAVAIVVAVQLIFQPFKVENTSDRPATAGENTLAVMYFENMVDRADSSRLGEIATNLLITDLSEADNVKVLSSQRLYDILKLKGKEGAKLIDRETATEVAQHAGARRMLLGSILQTEPHVLITAQLVDVGTGEIEASQRVSGEAGERVFALIDRLSDEVRKDLELPAGSSAATEVSVADATTHNREAYRSYLEGIEYERRYYFEQALEAFKRAAELDSDFAMAHYAVARRSPNSTESRHEIELAKKLSSSLGQREKRYINSKYASLHSDIETAIREMELLIEAYPDEKDAYFRLGNLYQSRDEQRAIEYYRRAVEIDPLFRDAYNQLAYRYQSLNEFDNAIWAITQYINVAPDEPNPYDSRADMYAQNGKLDQAIESYRKALAIDPEFHMSRAGLGHMYLFKRDYEEARKAYQVLVDADNPTWRTDGRAYLAYIPLAQGQWEEATRILHEGIAADQQETGDYQYFGPVLKLYSVAVANCSVTWEEGLAFTRSGIDLFRRFDPAFPFGAWEATELFWQLKGGQITPAEADSSFAGLRRKVENESPLNLPALDWVGGNIAMEQGRFHDAIESFGEAVSVTKPWFWYYPLLVCYLEVGRIDEAVELAERLLRWHSDLRAAFLLGVKIHHLAGKVYQAAGQSDKAIEQFELFLMIWKNADPVFPEIDDAKQRLEFLRR